MPRVFERTFRVRYADCDALGHVNNVSYLRYLQEAAFDASADAGFDFARYAALGHRWLIHQTEIEYLRPLRYGETARVKTWVADFRRIQSRRMYELTREGSGEAVARGHTDWVYVNAASGRPAPIPDELIRAFFPQADPPVAEARAPFPAAPPPPERVFRLRMRVRWRDLDLAWHVNNTVYAAYAEDAAFQLLPAFGWSLERMRAAGFFILPRRHQIEYRASALLDDELEVTTWASEPRRATALRHYLIRRVSDGALLARQRSLYVWMDERTGQPIRIPPDFLRDFAPNFSGGVGPKAV